MTNNIKKQIEIIKNSKNIGLMTHLVVGYPNIKTTIKLIETLSKAGSDFIELQIPFSDPIADGPTIMKSCDISLKNGTNTDLAFEIMLDATKKVSIPLLFMCYYNTILHYGVKKFVEKSAECGVSGFIVPDVPPEEEPYENFIEICEKNNISLIRVVSPASSEKRLQLNAKYVNDFIYTTSKIGVTGSCSDLDVNLVNSIENIKKYFSCPLAVGFGISKPEHVRILSKYVDIAIVGSAIIDCINMYKDDEEKMLEKVYEFVCSLKG